MVHVVSQHGLGEDERRGMRPISGWLRVSSVVLAGALGLVGCSSDAEEPAGAGSAGDAPSVSSAGRSVSSGGESSPAAAEPLGAGESAPASSPVTDPGASEGEMPVMPAAASENSEEGAEAFARWYVETLNYLYQHPKAGVLEKYADDGCKTCAQHADFVAEEARDSKAMDGEALSILGASALDSGPSKFEAVVAFSQNPVAVRDSGDKEVARLKKVAEYGYVFDLVFDGSWKIMKIHPNENPYYEKD